jgi:hypothetical protein
MLKQRKTAYLTARIAPDLRKSFVAKAQKYGSHTEVLRELIKAFVEDRVTISKPTAARSPLEKLYE